MPQRGVSPYRGIPMQSSLPDGIRAFGAGGRQFEYSEDTKEPASSALRINRFFGAAGQIRTADLVITNDALYRLSYSSMAVSNSFIIIA